MSQMDNLQNARCNQDQDIRLEKVRLSYILFEGAPHQFKWAAMDEDGEWALYAYRPEHFEYGEWDCVGEVQTKSYIFDAKNQPATSLGWKHSLIKRGDDCG